MWQKIENFLLELPVWIGSIPSLIVHVCFFIGIFILGFFGPFDPEFVFAITTNILSIEAIFLAILIQMSINKSNRSLQAVEKDIDEIQEDIDEIQEDVEDLGEDIDEIQEDIDEIQEDVEDITEEEERDERRKKDQQATLEGLTANVRNILAELESLKEKK